MKNTKIVFLAQQLKMGGVEKSLIMLANSFYEEGYEVIIYSVMRSDCIVPLAQGVKIFFLSDMVISKENIFIRFARKLLELHFVKKVILGLDQSIVISTRNEYSTILSKYSHNTVNIAILHNDYNRREKYDFIFHYKNIQYFIQLNENIRSEIEKLISKYNSVTKIVCIPNFIEKRQYDIEKMCMRENTVITVGGLRKEKGFDRLIDIWSLIAAKYPDWKLIIVGEGNEYHTLKEKIERYGLSRSIELKGYVANEKVMELMRKSKIYALSSYKEAFGFVIIEAMQNGLPIVAFDVRTGPATLIDNNDNGFLIPDYNNVLFARRLEEIINNEYLRNKLADRAILSSEKYEKNSVMKKWIEIINEAESVLRSYRLRGENITEGIN